MIEAGVATDSATKDAAFNRVLAIVAAAIVVAIIIGIIFTSMAANSKYLDICEDALKATLKAPSTYVRIEESGINSPDGYFIIDYDASNPMGVPMRGHGMCSLKGGKATWIETGRY